MGERNNEKVKWLIVGTFANDSVTALTDTDKIPLSQGLMLKETTYVMLSEKVLYTEGVSNAGETIMSSSDYGLSFQNNYTNSTNTSGYSAQDYATSNIRNYLKGESVYRTAKSSSGGYIPAESSLKINLLTDYNLASDPLYAKIQGRTLTSLYVGLYSEKNSSATIWSDNTTLPGTTQDKLWLLSYTEANEKIFTSNYNRKTTVICSSSSGTGNWWLRSPNKTFHNLRIL